MQRMLFCIGHRWPSKTICAGLLVFFSYLLCGAVNAEQPLSKEQKLKAAYLWNFTQYIAWPDSKVGKLPASIRICVDGSNNFFQFLQDMVISKRDFKGKNTVEVLFLDEARGCEVLYVRQSKKIASISLDHTVVVADSPSVAMPNAAIVFYQKNGKLRFEVDVTIISDLEVVVSSELLKLARIKQ